MRLTYREHIILLTALKVFEDVTRDTAPPKNMEELEELIDYVQYHAILQKRADERRERKLK